MSLPAQFSDDVNSSFAHSHRERDHVDTLKYKIVRLHPIGSAKRRAEIEVPLLGKVSRDFDQIAIKVKLGELKLVFERAEEDLDDRTPCGCSGKSFVR